MKYIFCGILCVFLFHTPNFTNAAEKDWMPPGSKIRAHRPPPEWIYNPPLKGDALLGKLLFHSTALLGEKAVRMGISCASCHPSGHTNRQFFIPGLSRRPGSIDLTNDFWYDGGDDHQFNPKPIPSLRETRHKDRFGTGPFLDSAEAFSRHVIVGEFGGPEPDENILNLLGAYMSRLASPEKPDAGITKRPIPFSTYLRLFEDMPSQRPLIASTLLEEAGRRQRHERRAIYTDVAAALKKLRKENLSEADFTSALKRLENLSRHIP